jgi:hypothetical protein
VSKLEEKFVNVMEPKILLRKTISIDSILERKMMEFQSKFIESQEKSYNFSYIARLLIKQGLKHSEDLVYRLE